MQEKKVEKDPEAEEPAGLVKQKSLLEDESVPFGHPIEHSSGTHQGKSPHFVHAQHEHIPPHSQTPASFGHPMFHGHFPPAPFLGYPPYPYYPGYQYPPFQPMPTFPHFNQSQVNPKKPAKASQGLPQSQYSYPYYPGYY